MVSFKHYNSDSPLLSDYANELDVFLNKAFWNWDKEKHDLDFLIDKNCCFNHIIGLPVKNDKQYPLFDYESLDKEQTSFNDSLDALRLSLNAYQIE